MTEDDVQVQKIPSRKIRLFLSSPSDVTEERAAVADIIDDLQNLPNFYGQVKLELYAWGGPGGAPLFAHLTPQEAISKGMPRPSECDIVIVIFWSRMGTPLPPEYSKPDGTPFLSGTEWEYWDALQAAQRTDSPEIIVYRREPGPSINLGAPDAAEKLKQYQRVENFFAAFKDPKTGSATGGYNKYETPDDFRRIFKKHLLNVLLRVVDANLQQQVRLLKLQYHRATFQEGTQILHRLADIGEPALEALLELRQEIIPRALSGSDTDKITRQILDRILMHRYPDVFSQIFEEALADADRERLTEIAVDLIDVDDERVLQQLVDLLESRNENIREVAVIVLGNHERHEIVPTLLQLMQHDPSETVRWRAIQALGNIGDVSCVPALLETLQSKDNRFDPAIIEAFGKLGDPQAVPALIELLDDGQFSAGATEALGKIGDKRASPALATLLQAQKDKDEYDDSFLVETIIRAFERIGHPDACSALVDVIRTGKMNYNMGHLRRSAAEALGEIGCTDDVPELILILHNGALNWGTRLGAIHALQKFDDPRITPAFIKALKDPDEHIRTKMAQVLGQTGDVSAIPALIEAKDDIDHDVRKQAVIALGEFQDKRAIRALVEIVQSDRDERLSRIIDKAKDEIEGEGDDLLVKIIVGEITMPDGDIRLYAIDSLRSIGINGVKSVLKDALNCENEAVRVKAAQALYEAGDVSKLKLIMDALQSDTMIVRFVAAQALSEIRESSTVPALIESLYDPAVRVRTQASVALNNINTPMAKAALEQWREDLQR